MISVSTLSTCYDSSAKIMFTQVGVKITFHVNNYIKLIMNGELFLSKLTKHSFCYLNQLYYKNALAQWDGAEDEVDIIIIIYIGV